MRLPALCCKVLGITELDKAPWKWCKHSPTHTRCVIYKDRPPSCHKFECGWLLCRDVPKFMKPSRSHVVITNKTCKFGYLEVKEMFCLETRADS
jgi:hypothetical protein